MITIIQIFISSLLFAGLTVENSMDLNGGRTLSFACSNGESFCNDLCAEEVCEFKVASCRDCMSTYNNNVQIFLVSLGSYLQTGDAVDRLQAGEYLTSNKLTVWDSRSIYNNSEFDGLFIRNRFSSLCPLSGFSQSPLILDLVDENYKFSYHNPKLVMCFYDELGLIVSPLQSSDKF